ncbi:hypothetical protein [Aquamicrobium terrae]
MAISRKKPGAAAHAVCPASAALKKIILLHFAKSQRAAANFVIWLAPAARGNAPAPTFLLIRPTRWQARFC